jgi:hypothetical protein
MRVLPIAILLAAICVAVPHAWNNGQTGNTSTTTQAGCSNPPYATHDWIADHALDLLPAAEKAWLVLHKNLYLIGTEAPDHKGIPASCGAPNIGYNDRTLGHSMKWNTAVTEMTVDRPAVRAQEEYNKAGVAFVQGKPAHAA